MVDQHWNKTYLVLFTNSPFNNFQSNRPMLYQSLIIRSFHLLKKRVFYLSKYTLFGRIVPNYPPFFQKRVPRPRLKIPPFLLEIWNTRRHPPGDPSAGAGPPPNHPWSVQLQLAASNWIKILKRSGAVIRNMYTTMGSICIQPWMTIICFPLPQ